MHVLFILAIIAGSIAVLCIVAAFVFNTPEPLIGTIAGALLALILWAAGDTTVSNNHRDNMIQVCEDKGGIVTHDDFCFKNNKPIEFTPGVWKI